MDFFQIPDVQANEKTVYKIKDLEKLFSLPDHYNETIIKEREVLLVQTVHNSTHSHEKKEKIQKFISEAKQFLLKNLIKQEQHITGSFMEIYNTDLSLKPSSITENNGSDFTIQKQVTPFTQSSPSAFYQGVINPLKKRILTNNVNVDTRFRENYATTNPANFIFQLPTNFYNVVSMELSSFEFSHSFYTISASLGNNYLHLHRKIGPDTKHATIVVPDGNYIGTDLLTTLTTLSNDYMDPVDGMFYFGDIVFTLDSNSTAGSDTGSGKIFVTSFPVSTERPLTLPPFPLPPAIPFPYYNTPFVLDFLSDINGNANYNNGTTCVNDVNLLQSKIGWVMGFRNGLYGVNIQEQPNCPPGIKENTYYISEGVLDLSGIKYIYFVVDDFNNSVNNSFYATFQKSINNNNILARLNVIQSFFMVDMQNNLSNIVTQPREYFGPVTLTNLKFQLLDEFGRIVNLNNMDYSFCLTLKTVYDL